MKESNYYILINDLCQLVYFDLGYKKSFALKCVLHNIYIV